MIDKLSIKTSRLVE